MENVQLTLATLAGGELDERFQELTKDIMDKLKKGDKASINIVVQFERIPDMTTMIATSFKIAPKFPTVKRAGVCQITGDNNLITEKPQPKPEKISLFGEAK